MRDVATARRVLDERAIDCILGDVEALEGDDFRFIRWIQRSHPRTPIVLLVKDASPQTVDDALEAGAAACLPIGRETTYRTLRAQIADVISASDETAPTRAGRNLESRNAAASGSPNREGQERTAPDAPPLEGGDQSTVGDRSDERTGPRSSHSPPETTTDIATAVFTLLKRGLSQSNSVEGIDGHGADLPSDTVSLSSGNESRSANSSPSSSVETQTGTAADPDADTGGFRFDQPLESDETTGEQPEDTKGESTDSITQRGIEGLSADELRALVRAEVDGRLTSATAGVTESDGGSEAARESTASESATVERFEIPEELSLDPGTSVLLQCGSHDERKHAACTDFLAPTQVDGASVLLIRYKTLGHDRLEQLASSAARLTLISIGCAQSVPPSLEPTVDLLALNNPNDVTRLGIVVTRTVDEWNRTGGDIFVCYDSLDVLLEYKDTASTFRFLHLFVNKLQSAGAVSHFHVDPSANEPQEINTLKPLFDSVLSIDSDGADLET